MLTAHRRRGPVPGGPSALALLTASGLAVTAVGVSSYAAPASADPVGADAAVAIAARPIAERASRASQRAAVADRVAVRAPARLAADAGATTYTVKAVAKPKPKPKPVVPAPVAASSPRTATTTGAAAPVAPRSRAGSAVPSASIPGLTSAASAVYAAVRATFGITNIGGFRPGDSGDHGSGRAVDVMTSGATGDAVAAYAIANMSRFGITYVIWRQRIWMAGSGGWQGMADRGSITANHFDHVHISVG